MKRKPIPASQSAEPKGNGAKVYSYIRFSTKEQAFGQSERRQTTLANAYAEKHGLKFDETLKMADRGTSAYKGDNIKFGALGAFLEEIKQGNVPKGSVLVVENVDRITRLEFWDAFDVLSKIIRSGVRIHTTSPEMTYDEDCAKDGRIYALVGQINLAHEESSKKSARVKQAWEAERELVRLKKSRQSLVCPKWLIPIRGAEGSVKYEVIPAARVAIRSIYELRLKGLGYIAICKRMNRKGFWAPPLERKQGVPSHGKNDRWRESYIVKVLRNRSVIGDVQQNEMVNGRRKPVGEPIPGVYPSIVERGVFDRVQTLLKKNRGKGKGGRASTSRNLFTRMARCGYCGSPMAHQPKGPKQNTILVCDAGRSGKGCGKSHAVRYAEFQETVLDNCAALRPEAVLPDENEQVKECQSLREQLAADQAMVESLNAEIDNFENLAGRISEPAAQDAYEFKAQQRRGERIEVLARITANQENLRQSEHSKRSVIKWTKDLAALKLAIAGNSDDAIMRRSMLREHLKEFILKVEVFSHGFKERSRMIPHTPVETMWPIPTKIGDMQQWREKNRSKLPVSTQDLEDYVEAVLDELPKPMPKPQRHEFSRFVVQQAMSRRGRFFRVFFKTRVVWDLVPEGGVAMGTALGIGSKSMRFVHPPLDKLWSEFERMKPARRSDKDAKGTR